jgi:ABC-type multidrug transport system fused ATPase/permease subunit
MKDVLSILSARDRRNWLLLSGLMCISALMDVVGVTSIMPFLAVLASPNAIEKNRIIQAAYEFGNFRTSEQFMLALGISSIVLLGISACVRSLSLYFQNLYIGLVRHGLSSRLLAGYLNRPYEFFLAKNTGEMGRNILSEVDQYLDKALGPMTNCVSSGFVLLAMIMLLAVTDPWSAFFICSVLCFAYVLIYLFMRRRLLQLGMGRLEANRLRFKIANEALSGVKMLKVLQREARYAQRYQEASKIFALSLARSTVIGQAPRFIVETIAFGAIVLLAVSLLQRNGGHQSSNVLATVLPVLGLYVLAGYRVLPAIQSIYQSLTQLRFSRASVSAVKAALDSFKADLPRPEVTQQALIFHRAIKLRNVTYIYPGSHQAGIMNIDLTLSRGSCTGIIGSTGSGKSTLMDVILGLLAPTGGEISIDGEPLTEQNVGRWQAIIGYVPQDIFLVDGSVAENIALGLPASVIDLGQIAASAKLARIHDFVEQLPLGYDTQVGERGLRLSGGERQRIGIARALYHNPELLVLDEATSALDNATEAEVMQSLEGLVGSRTILVVAHRISTLALCNKVVLLKGGRKHFEGRLADVNLPVQGMDPQETGPG